MNKVLSLRNALHMTQDEFAEYCNVSRISIARYEAGAEINRANAVKIATACGISVDELLGRESAEPDDDWFISEKSDDTIRLFARGMSKMSPENRERLLEVAKVMFKEDFGE